MRVNIEDVLENARQRAEWNKTDLTQLEFYEKGKKVEIPPECLAEFQFAGLLNTDFVLMRYWEMQRETVAAGDAP